MIHQDFHTMESDARGFQSVDGCPRRCRDALGKLPHLPANVDGGDGTSTGAWLLSGAETRLY
jgi:hypothetical protein